MYVGDGASVSMSMQEALAGTADFGASETYSYAGNGVEAGAIFDAAPADEQTLIASTATQIYQLLVPMISRVQQAQTVLAQSAEDNPFEQRVLELVNDERAKAGLGALTYDSQLDLASERHDDQQAATAMMSHDAIGDGTPGDRIHATGFSNSWGENVAVGQTSAEQVVAEWMASPHHRENILDPEFTKLGVAYKLGGDGRAYWAQSFGA